jgi:hypothetical protein
LAPDVLWRPQSLFLAEAFFGGSTACKFLGHTRTHIYAGFTLPLLCHMLLPPSHPLSGTSNTHPLTAHSPGPQIGSEPAQKEKGIKKSSKLSGIMPPTQEVIRLTKGVHHLSQGLRVMLWQFTFLTPFNAHLQPVEGSQQVKEAAVKETTPFIFLRKRWDLHGALSNVTGQSEFFRTFGKGTLRRWAGPCISKSVFNVTNSDGV